MGCDVNTISLDLIEYILISQSSDTNSVCECTFVCIYGMEREMRFPLILNSLLKNGNAPRYNGPHLEECRQNRTQF
jgi:hypothetical protein